MTVTEIRFNGAKNKNFLAYVSCVVGGCLKLRDMKLVYSGRDKGRKHIVMPARQDKEGNFTEVYHPIKPELRGVLEAAIFEAWERHEAIPTV